MGIEAISRGACFTQFNDISKDSIAVLKKNLSKLRDENFSVTNSDYSACRGVERAFPEEIYGDFVEMLEKNNV